MCTDNMPSGSAMKLGDVLTIHGGTTVEIHNTDAEGRLVLADGLALAVEEQPDAIVDIATLTGACMVALGAGDGRRVRHDAAVGRPGRGGGRRRPTSPCGSCRWQGRSYRKLLDSDVADLKNVGGPYGGAINAAVFLSEFVGDVPWAHLDIAGPMKVDADESWRSEGRHRLRHPPARSTWRLNLRQAEGRSRARRSTRPPRAARRPRRRPAPGRRRRRAAVRAGRGRRRRRASPRRGRGPGRGRRGGSSSSSTAVCCDCTSSGSRRGGAARRAAPGGARPRPRVRRWTSAEHHAARAPPWRTATPTPSSR